MDPTDYDDEDLAFDEGFKAEPDDKPASAAPTSAPTPQADKPAAPAAEDKQPEPEDDPFAAYPQAVRDLLGTVPKLAADVADLRRVAGMVPGLQREIDRLKTERAAPPPKEEDAPPPRFEKVANLRQAGLDDVADAIDEIAQAIPRQRPEPAAPAPPAPQDEPAKDPAIEALDAVRPDWWQTLQSTEAQLWLSQQPAEFQHELRSTDSPGVILKGLERFDAFRARTTQQRQADAGRAQRMAGAIAPRGDGRAPRGSASPADEEDAAMEAGFRGR